MQVVFIDECNLMKLAIKFIFENQKRTCYDINIAK